MRFKLGKYQVYWGPEIGFWVGVRLTPDDWLDEDCCWCLAYHLSICFIPCFPLTVSWDVE